MNYIDPEDTLHQSFLDIEPVTGKVLRRALRLQVEQTPAAQHVETCPELLQ